MEHNTIINDYFTEPEQLVNFLVLFVVPKGAIELARKV